jgi:hypothetical protein
MELRYTYSSIRMKQGIDAPWEVASVGLPPPPLVGVVPSAVAHAGDLLRQELALAFLVERHLLPGGVVGPVALVHVAPRRQPHHFFVVAAAAVAPPPAFASEDDVDPPDFASLGRGGAARPPAGLLLLLLVVVVEEEEEEVVVVVGLTSL